MMKRIDSGPLSPFDLLQRNGDLKINLHQNTKNPVGKTVLPLALMKKLKAEEPSASKHEITSVLPNVVKTLSLGKDYIKRFSGKKINMAENNKHLFGTDNRSILYDTSFPWRCIGKISWVDSKGIKHSGSASMIGRNFVITAAHVLPLNDLNYTIKFTPNYFYGKPQVGHESEVVHVAYWEAIEKDHVCGYDMVICRLAENLGDELGYFGSRKYKDDWEDGKYWYHVGYPYDLEDVPYWQGPLAVVDDDSDSHNSTEIETKADIASGQSGGPLIGFWDDGVRIIGVLSGFETEGSYSFPFTFTADHAVFAGGEALTKLVRWGRENW